MNQPKGSRGADELAAIDLLRKKPSWRATKRANNARTTRIYAETEPPRLEFVVFGLIALILHTRLAGACRLS